MKFIVYTAEQNFDENEFDEFAIIKARSRFYTVQVDAYQPSWLDGRILTNNLEDEVSYLQYG